MIDSVTLILIGAAAMASLVVALFFLRFWRQTRDSLFLWFAIAFATDSATRLLEGLFPVPDEQEPLRYVPRLITFALIIVAIAQKNRPSRRG
ncbi:MAG TPA: DUF5985 family protein [Xanthobacteraceae bacterium]|jgi:hypothetical protein|nr:DUF5985 family protein [Xanthobacteraceae bacterium]